MCLDGRYPPRAIIGVVDRSGLMANGGHAGWAGRGGLRHTGREYTCLSRLGVAFLPDHACAAHIAAGKLVRVFREWRSRDGIVHIVFTTRRGLPPAVRAFIDHLAKEFPDL